MARITLLKALLLLLLAFGFIGCEEQDKHEKECVPTMRSDVVGWSIHDVGGGHPVRVTVLRDGTELITIGYYENRDFLVLLRYADERKHTIISSKNAGELDANVLREIKAAFRPAR